MTTLPRRLRVVHDYPRATGCLGSPVLEASRVVKLPRSFPRQRTVSDGEGSPDLAWVARTAAHLAQATSLRRRGGYDTRWSVTR